MKPALAWRMDKVSPFWFHGFVVTQRSRKKETKSPVLPPRERLLQTARRLFQQHGIRATGIDKIIAEAGVAKMSFYRHFASKDLLIAECLRLQAEERFAVFQEAVEHQPLRSTLGLEIVAEALAKWLSEPGFRGCPLATAQAELPTANTAAQQIIRRAWVQLQDYLSGLARRLNYEAPDAAGTAALQILSGAQVMSPMQDPAVAQETARDLLRRIPRHSAKAPAKTAPDSEPPFLPGLFD